MIICIIGIIAYNSVPIYYDCFVMHVLVIPSNLKTLSRKLALWRENGLSHVHVCLYFDTSFITPGMLVMIASWGLEMRLRQIRFVIRGRKEILHYLGRMGFHQALGATLLNVPHYVPAGRFLPLQVVADSRAQTCAVDAMCELILKQFDNARILLPAFEWVVNELTDNVFIHAQTLTSCVLAAQYYPSSRQLEIAIADQGIGLLGTLGPAHGAINETHAIELALKRGLTRDLKIGQGNGLAGTEAIVESNRGELFIWTGETSLIRNEERSFMPFCNANGTGIILRLNVEQPVDLSDLWIGERHHTYLDSQAHDLDQGMPLFVVQECNSTGSREPARRLRNKIMALLPDVDNTILLDFADCNTPSSSFLDELFGRMILEIGLTFYQKKIEITGLDATTLDRANVVIHQRLQQAKAEKDIFEYT